MASPTPPLHRPIDHLADVCLQLIAHHLPVRSLLQWARCSRRCMRLIDTTFGWKHAQPMRLDSVHTAWKPQPSHLLRRAALSVLVRPIDRGGDLTELDLRGLFALSDVCPVVSLHLSFPLNQHRWFDNFSIRRFLTVYAHPSIVASLQCLIVERWGSIKASEMELFTQMPRLCTLMLRHTRPLGGAHWLASMPALTDLEIADLDEAALERSRSRCVQAVMQCTQLRRLNFLRPLLLYRDFAQFFESPRIRQLQHLRLTSVPFGGYADSPTAEEIVASLRSMTQLRSLHLHRAGHIDALLSHLRWSPLLTQLTIEAHYTEPVDEIGAQAPSKEPVPSVPALLSLLLVSRSLSCTLVLPFHSPLCPAQVAQSRNLRSQWASLANASEWTELGSRMLVQRDAAIADR